ncbi:MAG: 2-C-methyl-D-erythritol 4-phosphate cytidylyltransferase, partial [Luteolibacter sp.]
RPALNEVSERALRVTDVVSALACIGISVKLIESRHPNLKITTPADLAVAEALLNGASTPRSMA